SKENKMLRGTAHPSPTKSEKEKDLAASVEYLTEALYKAHNDLDKYETFEKEIAQAHDIIHEIFNTIGVKIEIKNDKTIILSKLMALEKSIRNKIDSLIDENSKLKQKLFKSSRSLTESDLQKSLDKSKRSRRELELRDLDLETSGYE